MKPFWSKMRQIYLVYPLLFQTSLCEHHFQSCTRFQVYTYLCVKYTELKNKPIWITHLYFKNLLGSRSSLSCIDEQVEKYKNHFAYSIVQQDVFQQDVGRLTGASCVAVFPLPQKPLNPAWQRIRTTDCQCCCSTGSFILGPDPAPDPDHVF